MLKETSDRPDKDRRWFSDDYFDLIVWYGKGRTITGFQLCYDVQRNERALTWVEGQGPNHYRIDSGESSSAKNMTPVLLPDGVMPYHEISRQFKERATQIDPDIYKLVLRKLKEWRSACPSS